MRKQQDFHEVHRAHLGYPDLKYLSCGIYGIHSWGSGVASQRGGPFSTSGSQSDSQTSIRASPGSLLTSQVLTPHPQTH